MLTLDRNAVGMVARALITANGQTTTLEVKENLRQKGFWAEQADVRNFMLDITSKDGDIQYRESGLGYRLYEFQNPVFPPVTAQDDAELGDEDDDYDDLGQAWNDEDAADNAQTLPKLNLDDLDVVSIITTVKIHRDDIPADYLVTDKFGDNRGKYVNVTRGQAKSAWARDMRKHVFEARTTKV